jgi:hypothetical protein
MTTSHRPINVAVLDDYQGVAWSMIASKSAALKPVAQIGKI